LIRAHSLSSEHFDQLAAGRPGQAATASVLIAQHDRLHVLSRAVLEGRVEKAPALREAVEVLSQVQSRAPAAAESVLQNGWFGSWISRCLEHGADAAEYLPRLGNFAAAAAWRAGMDASVEVAVEGGRVHLPTLGSALVGDTTGPARLRIRDGELMVDADGQLPARVRPDKGGQGWLPLRQLGLGPGHDGPILMVDDLDPLRDCYSSPPTGRLTAAEHADWATRGRDAWSLLTRHAAGIGERIAGWICTLMPLAPTTEDVNLSISSRDALRSVALSLPSSPVDFAVTLAHEHAHAMMNGLLLFVRVARPETPKRYFAPWRSDARPVIGMTHGIFAFLAVAELWSRLLAVPAERAGATEQLARRRLELRSAIDEVRAGGELTAAGRRLLDHCHRRLERLEAKRLDAGVQQHAEEAFGDLRAVWEAHNTQATA
jgi:uncharacterized protein